MIHILTSTSTILKVDVRPQESRIGDSNVKAVLNLKLKKELSNDSFSEQLSYLQSSVTAAYVSLNKLDQRARFRCSVSLNALNNQSFNFNQGSSSSGLGFALACFDIWWRLNLKKTSQFDFPIFTTGEILTSGQINPISQIHEKSESLCRHVEENRHSISTFYFCYPVANDQEIAPQLKERLKKLGGRLIACARLQEVLGELLGKSYDGDPLGRWVPFKGLKSFDYEDSIRFFGRDKDVDDIYNTIRHNDGLLIVSGASGTGKSSLIKAGVIPKLEKEYGSLYWASCMPQKFDEQQGLLKVVIQKLIDAWAIPCCEVTDVISLFNLSIEKGIHFFKKHLSEQSMQCFFYLDQFEEIFVQSDVNIDNMVNELSIIDSLAKLLPPLNIILIIGSEYLERLLENKALMSFTIVTITSELSSQEWLSIVREQALFSGITFELNVKGQQSLDEVIIEEALKLPFALAMMSLLLEKLFIKAQENNLSTMLLYTHYKEFGGLSGIATDKALSIIDENQPSDKLINQLFDTFVGITHDELPYVKKVSLKALESADTDLYKLVKLFIRAKLIISTDSKTDNIQFVYNDLFTSWDLLKNWFIKHHTYLKWKNVVNSDFIQWKNNKYLYKNISKSERDTPLEEFSQGVKAYEMQAKKEKLELTNWKLLLEGMEYFFKGEIHDAHLKKYLLSSFQAKYIFIGGCILWFVLYLFIKE